MVTDNGYNPLRWDCAKDGCFNKKCRPKIEVFADLLPGRIAFSDVDGIVEINGHALMLEWKRSVANQIPAGQGIMYSRLTRRGQITVIVVEGDPETMTVQRLAFYRGGRFGSFRPADMDDLRKWIAKWVQAARADKSYLLSDTTNERAER